MRLSDSLFEISEAGHIPAMLEAAAEYRRAVMRAFPKSRAELEAEGTLELKTKWSRVLVRFDKVGS